MYIDPLINVFVFLFYCSCEGWITWAGTCALSGEIWGLLGPRSLLWPPKQQIRHKTPPQYPQDDLYTFVKNGSYIAVSNHFLPVLTLPLVTQRNTTIIMLTAFKIQFYKTNKITFTNYRMLVDCSVKHFKWTLAP